MGDSYQKALVELRAGNWEIARDLVVKGATSEEQCGMCMFWLSDAYNHGYWFPEDNGQYLSWLHKAADKGCGPAIATVSSDRREIEGHIIYSDDAFTLFCYFVKDHDYNVYYPWLLRAGLEKNIFALYELCEIYTPLENFEKRAAATGYAPSQFRYRVLFSRKRKIRKGTGMV